MFGLGATELVIILVIVLIIFGAGKLPQIGDALGRSIKNFKRASSGQDELEVSKKDQLEAKKASRELDAGEVEDAEVVTKAKAKKA